MVSLHKPSAEVVRTFLAAQAGREFTYPAVGATRTAPPSGYALHHTRTRLGDGEPVFAAARAALGAWRQLRLGWLEPWPSEEVVRPGEAVALLARLGGLWWLTCCRVVYVVDETGPAARFGYAYGTLPGHMLAGEERFLVEWDRDGGVWYDVLAFSRPRRLLARLGYPYVRWVQRGFGPASAAAMDQAVAGVA
jgi:uncharacterized protein (UPF0548 family)